MKKRMLAWLLVVAMMLGQVPVSAFAVEKETTPVTVTGEQSATEPAKATEAKPTEPTKATEETGATEPSEGTGETSAPTEETGAPTEETTEPTEGSTAPAEETTEPTEGVNEAVAAVEGAIAALPAQDVLEALDEAAQYAAYEQAQAIADAYDALTEEQQGKVANFETLKAFLEWFAVPETLADGTVTITRNGTLNTYYHPLGDVISSLCQDGDTVALLCNANTAYTETFTIDKSITLDLNGKTWTVNAGLTLNSTITIKNGTLNGEVTIGANGNVTMNDVQITTLNVSDGSVTLSGGHFGSIVRTDTSPAFSAMLAEGYVFLDASNNIVDISNAGLTTLSNVHVAKCTHGDWKDVEGKYTCGYCGFECTQHTFDTLTGKCTTCQKNIAVAKVTSTTGGTAVTNYYQSFPAAYGAVPSDKGDTLTLLQDVSMTNTEWYTQVGASLEKSFTFDLNGHSCGIVNTETVAYQVNFGGTVTVKNGTIPYLLAMSDSQVELDGVASTQVTCNDGGNLEVKGNCNIPILICQAGGKLTVCGGTIGSLTVNDSSATYVALAGGSFTEITISDAIKGYDMPSFLPGGYIYRKNTESDTSYLKNSELKEKSTLENVTVIECPHPSFAEPDEDSFVKCDYCDSSCVHTSGVDTDGKCNTCKTQMEVAVTCTEDGSEITSYRPKLTVALAQISDESSNITVKLLVDVTVTENIRIDKSMTLDLNGKTLDVGTGALLFSTTATLKNGTVKGNVTAKPNADVKDMKLTVESVTVENGKLWVDGIANPVSVTVKDGSLNELRVESDGQNAQVQLYGGSYGKIPNDMMLIPAKSFLPEGYAYQKDGTFLSLSELGNPLENVTVTKCTTHGAPASDGSCGYCGTKLEASVTVNGTTTYCKTFEEAVDYVNQSSDATLKLLADTKRTAPPIEKTCTLDLNGKNLTGDSVGVNDGTTTIQNGRDASDVKIFLGGQNAVVCVESGYVSKIDFGFNGGKAEINGGTVKEVFADKGIVATTLAITITDGQVDQLTVDNPKCKVSISGGTFKEVTAPTGSSVCSLLASGYAFYQKAEGGTDYTELVNGAVQTLNGDYQVKTHTHSDYVNGTCPCGYVCPHTTVTDNECTECHLTFVAQLWRDGNQVGWLTKLSDGSGLVEAIQAGDTIKLTQNGLDTQVTINKAVTLDLNGHLAGTAKVTSTGVTIQDSTVTQEGVAGAIVSELNVQGAVTLGKGTAYGSITIADGESITIPDGYGFYKPSPSVYTYQSDSAANGMTNVLVLKNPTNDWTITFKDENGNDVKADELVYGKTYTATANPGTYVPTTATMDYIWKYYDNVLEPIVTSPYTSPTFKFTCKQAVATLLGCEITINGYKITKKLDDFEVQKADIPTDAYTAPKANTLFYKGIDQKLVTAGTVDGTKFTGDVQYKLEGGDWSEKIPAKMDAGEYKVYWRIVSGNAAYKNHEPKDPITVTITNDWQPELGKEFTMTDVPNAEGWVKDLPTITAKEGYHVSTANTEEAARWQDSLGVLKDGSFTFYVKDTKTGAISLPVTYSFKWDTNNGETKTVATVSFSGGSSWGSFIDTNLVSFNQLFKEAVTVTVKAKDLGSGVATIEYAESDKALTLEQVKELTNWSVMSTAVGTDENGNTIGTKTVAAKNGKQFVCYIRITDAVGNVTYLSTNGATFDTKPPEITSVTDGETAYTTRVVQITDKHPVTVTLNGEPKTLTDGKLTLPGNVNQIYTIVATDKVGNETTVKVFMSPTASITDGVKSSSGSPTVNNVTSDFKGSLENVKTSIQKEQKNTGATPAEQDILKKKLDWVNNLLKRLEDVEKACNTDSIQKVKDITANNVKLEDKTDLEKAKADLNKALTDYEKNLTEAEKKTLNEKIDTIDKALKAIENVENVEKLIGDLPKTITGKDSKAVKEAEKAYNDLTAHEKELVSSTSLKKLQAARKTLNRLNGDPTSPNTGDESHVDIWFTTLILSAAALVLLKKRKVVS